jgi:hypothetical protein
MRIDSIARANLVEDDRVTKRFGKHERLNRVFVLYGVADRDPDELVCQFFDKPIDVVEFVDALPGRYDLMELIGVDFDRLTVIT